MTEKYNDHVVCNACNTEQVVKKGSEYCLNCKQDGCLAWIENTDYEILKEPCIIGGKMTQEERKQKRDQLLNKLTGFLNRKLDNLVIAQEVGSERMILIAEEWNDLFEKYPKLDDWITHNLDFPYTSERMEVIIGFFDEWTTCTECNKAFRMDSDLYINTDEGPVCLECAPDFFDDILDEYNNNWNKALPYWTRDQLLENGWEKLNEDSYEAGLHEHQNDSPEQVFNEFVEKLWENLVFVIDSTSPFTIEFDIYGKGNESKEEESVTNVTTFTVHDVIEAGYTLEPLKCLHCGKIGEITFQQSVGDAYCEHCGLWQLDDESPSNVKPLKCLHSRNVKTYLAGHSMSGIKKGDKVRVFRKADDYERGWYNSWIRRMDNHIGELHTVSQDTGASGFELEPLNPNLQDHWDFPFFVLEKIEEE